MSQKKREARTRPTLRGDGQLPFTYTLKKRWPLNCKGILSLCVFSVVLMKSHLCQGHKNILKESVDPSIAWRGPLSLKQLIRLYTRCGQTLSVKDQIVNSFVFANHWVSVAPTQLCLIAQKQP